MLPSLHINMAAAGTWLTANQGTVLAVLVFLATIVVPNLLIARRNIPQIGLTPWAGFWWVLGRAAFLCFKNAHGSIKWPGSPQGPEVMTYEEAARLILNKGAAAFGLPSVATPAAGALDEARQALVGSLGSPDESGLDAPEAPSAGSVPPFRVLDPGRPVAAPTIPRLLPGRPGEGSGGKIATVLIILLLGGVALANGGCAAATTTIGGIATGLAIVVDQTDKTYSAHYKSHSDDYIGSPGYRELARTKGAEAAVAAYKAEMKPWDEGVDAITGARAAVFAVGTAAQATKGPERVQSVIKSLAYSAGTVIGLIQTVYKRGVVTKPAVMTALTRACIFTTALATGAGMPPETVPKACSDLVATGTLPGAGPGAAPPASPGTAPAVPAAPPLGPPAIPGTPAPIAPPSGVPAGPSGAPPPPVPGPRPPFSVGGPTEGR